MLGCDRPRGADQSRTRKLETNLTGTTIPAATTAAPKARRPGHRTWLRGNRIVVALLLIVAVVLAGLVARNTIFPATPKAAAARLVSATIGDVTSSVPGTGS